MKNKEKNKPQKIWITKSQIEEHLASFGRKGYCKKKQSVVGKSRFELF